MPSVLMVAFHYPPCSGSSGVLRTLKFSCALPSYGWRPLIVTAHPRAYQRTAPHQLAEIPADAVVSRAFALDARRHLAIGGRTLRALSLPDRWITWWLGAVPRALALVRRYRPRAIWSTYPIATAHLVGLTVQRLTGLPWIADFRDSMTEESYPPDPTTRRLYREIEQRAMARAATTVFVTPGARRMYLQRYPDVSPDRCVVIPNGYDEDDFRDVRAVRERPDRQFRLVHSGLVYTEERDPRPLFAAIAHLKRTGVVSAGSLRIDLRAPGNETQYAGILADHGIADIVHLVPSLPYRDALQDAASADALLLLQGASCDHQIPAKVYEYFRIGSPILALTSPKGDTATLLGEVGGATITDLHDERAIATALPRFLNDVRQGVHPRPDPIRARRFTRSVLTGDLARCLDAVAANSIEPRFSHRHPMATGICVK